MYLISEIFHAPRSLNLVTLGAKQLNILGLISSALRLRGNVVYLEDMGG